MQNWLITAPTHLNIPARAARSLINDRDGMAALLFFHMQLNGGRLDGKERFIAGAVRQDGFKAEAFKACV